MFPYYRTNWLKSGNQTFKFARPWCCFAIQAYIFRDWCLYLSCRNWELFLFLMTFQIRIIFIIGLPERLGKHNVYTNSFSRLILHCCTLLSIYYLDIIQQVLMIMFLFYTWSAIRDSLSLLELESNVNRRSLLLDVYWQKLIFWEREGGREVWKAELLL